MIEETGHGYTFGGGYIPAHDSPYLDIGAFGALQSTLLEKTAEGKKFFIIGDFNARVWTKENLNGCCTGNDYSYCDLKDNAMNENGPKLLKLCRDTNGVIMNNIMSKDQHYKGSLCFKRKQTWISEINLCVCSANDLDSEMFEINQRQNFPSDQAALELCLNNMTPIAMEYVKSRALSLGQSVHQKHTHKLLKGLNHNRIDQLRFINELSNQRISSV